MSKAAKAKKHAAESEDRRELHPETTDLAQQGKTVVAEIKSSITQDAMKIIHEIMPQKVHVFLPS